MAVVGLGSIGGIVAGCLRDADRHDVVACVRTPLDRSPLKVPYRTGALGLGVGLPLAIHLVQAITGRPMKRASRLSWLVPVLP